MRKYEKKLAVLIQLKMSSTFVLQLPEQYRLMTQMPVKKKHKHKKHKKEIGKEGLFHESQGKSLPDAFFSGNSKIYKK